MSRFILCALLILGGISATSAGDYGCNCTQDSCITTWLHARGGCWQGIWDTYNEEHHYCCGEGKCKRCHGGCRLGACGLNAGCGCGCEGVEGGTMVNEGPVNSTAPAPATVPTPPEPASPSDAVPSVKAPTIQKTGWTTSRPVWVMPRATFTTNSLQSWAR